MPGMEWTLEIVLVVLLGATLLQAIRLERALGVLKRDRASLEALVAGFNASTQAAESGIQRLHEAADTAGREIEARLAQSSSVRGDLLFLTERGDRLADRLDKLVRAARPLAQESPVAGGSGSGARETSGAVAETVPPASGLAPANQAERDLLQALRLAR